MFRPLFAATVACLTIALSACTSTTPTTPVLQNPATPPQGTTCNGVKAGAISGNVVVPDGGNCVLSLGSVQGDVYVGRNANLSLSGNLIGGSVRGEGFANVQISGNKISGSVVLNNGGSLVVAGNDIGGDLSCSGNKGGVEASGNRVTGSRLGQCR